MSPLSDILHALKNREIIAPDEFAAALEMIMDGAMGEAEIGAFLMGLGPENESIDNLVAAAQVLRSRASLVDVSRDIPGDVIDCCGTGGDGFRTYNISTTVAIIAAACGLKIAKHGNRAASSQSGAADILEALGIKLLAEPDHLRAALSEIGFAFFMAPHHHSGLGPLSKIRKQLGFRTLFNLLGPLANPAGASIQLVGVYDKSWAPKIAQALGRLGAKRALAVYGEVNQAGQLIGGLDEISLMGRTYCTELNNGKMSNYTLDASDFNLPQILLKDIQGGSPEHNANKLTTLLAGKKSAYRDIVLANTAALLKLTGKCESLHDGVCQAAKAIDNGAARDILDAYKEFSQNQIKESAA